MDISQRVQGISESVTLKLNAKATELAESGRQIFNLTAGQLPFRPLSDFSDLISHQLEFLKSYQYSPAAGFPELRQKLREHVEKTREISFSENHVDADVVVTNGGKHALSNIMTALLNPGDEVLLLAPHWISYTEMVKLNGGEVKVVGANVFDAYIPSLEEIENQISEKTKVLVLNSPNNPSGVHYPDDWMKGFAELLQKYPEVTVISDEIYYHLYYYDPKPTYYYQHDPKLLERTVIVDGISKTLASTGLRIGYLLAPKELTKAISRLQGQTTSGANSLIQRALMNFDFEKTDSYLKPIRVHLRDNSQILREKLREGNLYSLWYQTSSAFYFLLDLSQSPVMKNYRSSEDDNSDYASKLCEDLLENEGVALVPGSDFGAPNTVRISLVSPHDQFEQAVEKLVRFLNG